MESYTKAITLKPNYVEAINNQGVILLEAGAPEKAIPFFESAIKINPHFAIALNNLGNALTQLTDYQHAFECFKKALQINNRYLDAYLNFGNSLKKLREYNAAIDCFQQALTLDDKNPEIYYLLGEVYYDMGDCDLAKNYYTKSLALNPNDIGTQCALTIAQLPKAYRSEEELIHSRAAFAKQLDQLQTDSLVAHNPKETLGAFCRHPFYLTYQEENNKQLLSQYGVICTNLSKSTQQALPHTWQPKSNPKIRVGIVSGYFCNHPVWHAVTKGWVNHLNRSLFDVTVFNTNGLEDEQTELAKSKSSNYVNCGSSLQAAAQIIAKENVDVLLYPEIGMDKASKALACLRLAPLQAVGWGHPETSGLPTMDLFISAELLEPIDANSQYSESLIRLPNLGTHLENERVRATNIDLKSLKIDSSLPIYICAGSPSKYSPTHDYVLVEIAKKLSACQFIFLILKKI